MHNNIFRKTTKVMTYIGIAGLIMLFSPWLFNIDPMDGGGALIMVGLLLSVTGAITVFLYNKQAKALDEMFAGKDLLAKWELSTEEWEDFFPRAEKAARNQKFVLWIIMTFFFVLFSTIFYFFFEDGDSAQYFLLTMGAIWLFISGLLYFIVNAKKSSAANREIFIGKKGVYVNGQAHLWKGVGTRLVDVAYLEADDLLKFTYSSPAAYSAQLVEVLVPIANRHPNLKKVLEYFGIQASIPQQEEINDQNYFETEL
jgi:hypothetical protein